MEIDIQALVSQIGKLTSEESISKVTPAEDDFRALSAVNNVRSNQQETKQTLQDMVQHMSDPKAPSDRSSDQELQSHDSDAKTVESLIKPESARKDDAQANLIGIPVNEKAKNIRICSPGCPCPCHIQTKIKTPEILRQIAGRLFFGYSGHPVVQRECISSCYPKDSKAVTMTYFFPTWFAKQAIFLSMSNTAFNTPTFNLKLRRVVPEVSPLFVFSKYNAGGVRKLFDDRLASPDDIHIRGGWSPLHVSLSLWFAGSKTEYYSLPSIMAVSKSANFYLTVARIPRGRMPQGCKCHVFLVWTGLRNIDHLRRGHGIIYLLSDHHLK